MDVLRAAVSSIPGVTALPDGDERRRHANYCLVIRLEGQMGPRRNDVLLGLKERGVGASVYYPVAVPLSSYYRDRYGAKIGQFPIAESLAFESLALPVGPHLNEDDMDYIGQVLAQVMETLR